MERDRLGRAVKQPVKQDPSDYVLGVLGSSAIVNDEWVHAGLDKFIRTRRDRLPCLVIVGADKGVPASAVTWARAKRIEYRVIAASPAYEAKWPRYEFGNLYRTRRNEDIVDMSDAVAMFWRRRPRAWPSCVSRAFDHGKVCYVDYADPPTEAGDGRNAHATKFKIATSRDSSNDGKITQFIRPVKRAKYY